MNKNHEFIPHILNEGMIRLPNDLKISIRAGENGFAVLVGGVLVFWLGSKRCTAQCGFFLPKSAGKIWENRYVVFAVVQLV